ncbi:insulinase family protein [bacterium]|nr:insulinase family protein [bacterium]
MVAGMQQPERERGTGGRTVFDYDYDYEHEHETGIMQPTQLYTLKNGMPLLIMENHEVAVATADVWVRTGGADEPAPLLGVSHFLEHMLFKGTERFGLGEIERAIENLGGVSNAGTSFDFTHYYVTIPAASIGVAIQMLAEMMRHSTLDPTELEKERLVILEEYRRKQDHPVGVLFEKLYSEFFEDGPYHDPVIGYEETIRAIDRDGMLDYYHKRYSPGSSALIVVGDVDSKKVIEQAEAAFAGFDRPLTPLIDETPQRLGAGKYIHVTKPTGGEVYVTFSLPAPGMNDHERAVVLDVIQCILGQGRASRLYQSIKEKQGLCSSIGCHYPSHLRNALMVVVATCLPEQRDRLREALLEELREFAANSCDGRALERARRLLDSAQRFSMETTGGAAGNIGSYFTLTGSTEFLDRYLERLAAVKIDDVRAAAIETIRPAELERMLVEVSVGPDASA